MEEPRQDSQLPYFAFSIFYFTKLCPAVCRTTFNTLPQTLQGSREPLLLAGGTGTTLGKLWPGTTRENKVEVAFCRETFSRYGKHLMKGEIPNEWVIKWSDSLFCPWRILVV